MIKIIIADDHQLVREGLKKIVSEDSLDIQVTGEASNAIELMGQLTAELPDLVILDITMPGKSGLDVLRNIKELYPVLPVLILSMHPEHRFATRVFKAGAAGYLAKTGISEELINAIRVIAVDKRRFVSPAVAELLAQQINMDNEKPLHNNLSNREYEILCLIASGKKITAISEELQLSPQTIHTYRARVKEKMNMKSNVELTRYAIMNGLID